MGHMEPADTTAPRSPTFSNRWTMPFATSGSSSAEPQLPCGGEPVPPAYVDLISSLAIVTGEIAGQLSERRLALSSRDALTAIARSSSLVAAHAGLSAEVIRAQVPSAVVDLLMLTGLTYHEARERVSSPADDVEGDFEDDGDEP